MKFRPLLLFRPRRRARGFSLAEVTIVVAILGVMTALALPIISQVATSSSESKYRKSARDIVSMAASAVAAGDTSIPAAPDVESAVRLLIEGVTIEEGIAGLRFQLQGLTEAGIENVARYLRLQDGLLIFAEPEGEEG